MKSPAEVLAPASPNVARRARAIVEAWALQAVLFARETWGAVLCDILTLSDFCDAVNLATYRAILLGDGDLVQVGRRLHADLEARDWDSWVDRYCGGYDLPLEEFDLDGALGLLRNGDDADLVGYVYGPGSVLTFQPRTA